MLYDSTKVLTEVLSFVNKRTKLRSLTFVINHFSQNNRSGNPTKEKFTPNWRNPTKLSKILNRKGSKDHIYNNPNY